MHLILSAAPVAIELYGSRWFPLGALLPTRYLLRPMQRTYSRKGTRRATRSALASPEHSPEPAQSRKKRRIEVEVVADAHLQSSALGVVDRSLVGSDCESDLSAFTTLW